MVYGIAQSQQVKRDRARSGRRALLFLLSGILWAAFTLRVNQIDRQSIWYDEGLSIYYARGTLSELLRAVSRSDHPPLHALLLHGWMSLCGDSELAVRVLSTWWGVLAVALLYRLARRVEDQVGTVAALMLAVSPFAVWFSQEVRGYTLALALVIGAGDAFVRLVTALRKKGLAPWSSYVAYLLWATAAMYAHFYSGFVLLALALALPILTRVHLARWAATQGAILLLFAPWFPFVFNQLDVNATYWHGAVGWRQIVSRTLIAFSVGKTLDGPWATLATCVMALLAGGGMLTLKRRHDGGTWGMMLTLWMIVPVAILIWLNRSRPKFAPRYLLNALPPFLILASLGIHAMWNAIRRHRSALRWLAAATLTISVALIGGATTRSLYNLYYNRRLYRPDVRAVARYIATHASANDLIVLVGGHNYPAFTYYYRGPLPVLPLPDRLLPTTREPIDLRALGQLNRAINGHERLWLVLWQEWLADPTGLIVDELEHTYHRLGVGEHFHDIALLCFDISPGPLLADQATPQSPLDATLGGQVRLLGYDLPVRKARPGETLYLYLFWEALRAMEDDYKVFTQVLDEEGHIIAQHDKIAGAEGYPTSRWPPGAIVRERFMLTIHPNARPGKYYLIAGLYRAAPGLPRLPAVGADARGDYVLLAEVEVTGQ